MTVYSNILSAQRISKSDCDYCADKELEVLHLSSSSTPYNLCNNYIVIKYTPKDLNTTTTTNIL